jgi:hypothetical protein
MRRSTALSLFLVLLSAAEPLPSGQKPEAPAGTGAGPVKAIAEPPLQAGQTPQPAPPAPANVFPGGILDNSGRAAYLAGPDDDLQAIDLLTGDILWRTHQAQVPILVVGDHLIAQAGVRRNRIRLLTLDLKHKGEVLQESDPVVFPRWVIPGEAAAHTFEARWRLDGSKVVLNWQASVWADSQQLPTHREPTTRKTADGRALIDLESGEVETGPAEKPPPAASASLPRQLQKQDIRWHRIIGRYLVALVVVEHRSKKKPGAPQSTEEDLPLGSGRLFDLEIRSWELRTGKPQRPYVAYTCRQPVILASLDNYYLLFREALPAPDEMAKIMGEQKRWWSLLYVPDLAGGARVPYVPGMHSVQVMGARVFYLTPGPITGPLDQAAFRPQTLQCFDIEKRKVVWEHPVAGKAIHPPGL